MLSLLCFPNLRLAETLLLLLAPRKNLILTYRMEKPPIFDFQSVEVHFCTSYACCDSRLPAWLYFALNGRPISGPLCSILITLRHITQQLLVAFGNLLSLLEIFTGTSAAHPK